MRDLRAAIHNLPPAEHEYDWAPMHMPGSVQAYGVLLVADTQTRRVLFVSDNAMDMFGIAPADILNKTYLTLADHERERKFITERVAPDTILFPNPVRMTIKGRAYDAVFHNHAGAHQIQIEPVLDSARDYDELAMRATAELYDPPSVDELYQRAVRTIREASGFDRVMLYRFDARNNGQVIAEATRDGIGSFLGLFFPSGDIAARARDLYLQNFTRYIPDIGAKSYPLSSIFPGGGRVDSAHPVDMSFTNLRSVFPCHITYLQNIGIQASMSFSINVDGKLWGLFACHHYAPCHVSYDQRVVCEQTSMMFIYRLVTMSSSAARLARRGQDLSVLSQTLNVAAVLRRRLASLEAEWNGSEGAGPAHTMLARAIEAVEAESSFLLSGDGSQIPQSGDTVTASQKLLLDLVEADSAAIVRHGRVSRIGDAPPEMAIYAIASMFGRELPDLHGGNLHIYATDCLSTLVPVAEGVKDRAAGVLAVALSLDTPAYLLWFRREQIVHATWAGNPTADALAAGTDSQNPRASFEAWKQDIRNLSRPWLIEDVTIADELATVLRGLNAAGEATALPQPSGIVRFPASSTIVAPAQLHPNTPAVPPHRVIRIGQR
ncbi:MAG: GAF domain-containing protein [Rhodopila sp.]|jgi:light-regulated signal transduction histidine kinase (bacteriophytochrome)